MTYSLEFLPSALREWRKLGATIRTHFGKKLEEHLATPRVEADRLRRYEDCYKIKLRAAGYRLVYRVEDARVTVLVVAVGRRERDEVYLTAAKRRG